MVGPEAEANGRFALFDRRPVDGSVSMFTCVSVRFNEAASPARSELAKSRFMSKVDSSWKTCSLMKAAD